MERAFYFGIEREDSVSNGLYCIVNTYSEALTKKETYEKNEPNAKFKIIDYDREMRPINN